MPVSGEFPVLWKEGRMVLLPKPGRFPDTPSAFRPVCFLDEADKLLERVVAACLELHLSRNDPGLHDSQFGFRRGRSTADAVASIRSLIEGAEWRGCVALAVSLDVINAFSSIPWDRICRALELHRVSAYLRCVVRSFLQDRSIVYTVRGGRMPERAVYRGVPQGSALLWSIAYDAVLRAPMPPNSALACYADDTWVLVLGSARGRTVRLAELAVACVVAAIKGLGLRMSPEKSETMWFCRRADHGTPPAGYHLRLEGTEIEVGTSMKYLDLTLDSHWTFGAHFEHLAPSIEATVNALGRLLPRPGGPGVGVRWLYASVVRSRFLYGDPIWVEDLMTSCRSLLRVRRLHKTVAIRLVRGFSTISAAAAAVLAGFPPFELQALRCREIYLHTRSLSDGVGPVGVDVMVRARRTLLDRWRASFDMRAGAPGLRILEAVLPNWDVWLDGGGPPLSYRVTQVLTGHGCFDEYLSWIGKKATARCHHCDASVDSAQHTLEYCPTWARPRRDLIVEIERALSHPAIPETLLVSERERRAMTSFCEQVMLRKEAAERLRVRNSILEGIGRRGRGRGHGHISARLARSAALPGGGQT